MLRYPTSEAGEVDGLPAGEGAFLPCTFWLADNYVLQGGATRPARCSSACVDSPTTSACWPRSTTRGASACSAIFRRRSRTCR